MAESLPMESFKILFSAGLPELGPGPRAGVMPQGELDAALEPLLRAGPMTPVSRVLVRGLFLLWHDHFDPAHAIAQDIDTADGSLLHAILHRREPDYGNAAYWFRRVGRHASFPLLTTRVNARLESAGESALLARLTPGGQWDPFAFINLCEKSAGRVAGGQTQLLREIQGLESEILLEYWLS
jgi:hypothetical protein